VERAVSHYSHQVLAGRETRPIGEGIFDESKTYIARSRYHLQISRYTACFPSERILILDSDELRARHSATLQEAFRFLGVDEAGIAQESPGEVGTTAAKRVPTGFGIKLSDTMERPLSYLPKDRARQVKQVLVRPFSKPMEKLELDDPARQRLRALLADDTERFRSWSGMTFPRWDI
jgi:hypothetical protein